MSEQSPWDAILEPAAIALPPDPPPDPLPAAEARKPARVAKRKASVSLPIETPPVATYRPVAKIDPRVIAANAAVAEQELLPPPEKRHGVVRTGTKFKARIWRNGKFEYLGLFAKAEDAHDAYIAAGGRNYTLDFTPTDQQRVLVRNLAMWGLTADKICAHVFNPMTGSAIAEKTLMQHFSEEVGQGQTVGDRVVVQSLYEMMFGKPPEFMLDPEGNMVLDKSGRPIVLRQELKPNVAAAIFLAKVRPGIGMRETVSVEHGKRIEDEVYEKIKAMPRDKLLAVRNTLRAVVSEQPESGPESSGPPSE